MNRLAQVVHIGVLTLVVMPVIVQDLIVHLKVQQPMIITKSKCNLFQYLFLIINLNQLHYRNQR